MKYIIVLAVVTAAYLQAKIPDVHVKTLDEVERVLIFGVTGQDGSYLAELALENGCEVHGVKRRSASFNTERLDHLYKDPQDRYRKFFLHYGDVTDPMSVMHLVATIRPHKIFNLAAQSHVKVSFEVPFYTAQVDAIGTLNILEAIRILNLENYTRFYQASTSEMFGKVQEIPQKETTPFYPRSPYGVAKLYSHWIIVNYREAYNIFACSGILFNHESPRRGGTFVTRKITRAVGAIARGENEILYLGNLDASRDWGYAKDYVDAMWLMLEQDEPRDYVIATGETHTVREFVEKAFAEIGITIAWRGTGSHEEGYDKATGLVYVKIDERYYRPTEVEYLLGDASLARTMLGWIPKTSFHDLVKIMVQADKENPCVA